LTSSRTGTATGACSRYSHSSGADGPPGCLPRLTAPVRRRSTPLGPCSLGPGGSR
jgi:hypothetical protein